MSNFDRVKNVSREGFHSREDARQSARNFMRIGGKVAEGGERPDGTWGWTGEIRVEDSHEEVEGNFGCGRCAMTGRFITYVENGIPRGPGGVCFRCDGKGYHTREDRKRNAAYDRLAISRAAWEMMSS